MWILIAILSLVLIIIYYFFNIKNNDNKSIPKVIYQTYYDKDRIPKKVFSNIKKYAKGFKHIIYNDIECINFIQKYFGHKIKKRFIDLRGAHKADLFRYCILYVYGGIYLDIKSDLIMDLDKIFTLNNTMYTVLAKANGKIYQGIIASPKNNPIFLKLIDFMVNIDLKNLRNNYHIFTKDMYNKINKLTQGNRLREGLNISHKKGINYYLFKEKCTNNKNECYDGLDRYGYCCYVYRKNEKIIKTRYSDFPW